MTDQAIEAVGDVDVPRGRGRQPGFRMTEAHRDKIRNSNILNALVEHVEGRREMSPSQVTAGLGLLRKVLPDISEQTTKGDDDAPLEMKVRGAVELIRVTKRAE